MRVTDVPFSILRLQYRVARFPLRVIEDRVMSRLDPETPVRLSYERLFGLLDASVAGALGDSDLAQAGVALSERSDALSRAAKLSAAAEEKQQQADANLAARRDAALSDVEEAREQKNQNIEQAQAEAAERKSAAVKTVQKRTATAKQRADEVAAQRVKSVEDAKRNEQAKIRDAEQKVVAAAESELKEAEAARSAAASKRSDADQLDNLAEGEKRKRQAERANDA